MNKKGFTLVELLIVIGILAILATAVIIVLNPAELLKQARDSQRLQDLGTLNAAIAFYMSTASAPTISADTIGGTYATTGASCGDSKTTTAGTTDIDGTGWVKVPFTALTDASPIAVLPIDPTNNATYHYCFQGTAASLTWELDCILESTKYATTEDLDANTKDGGDAAGAYELGTDEDLDVI